MKSKYALTAHIFRILLGTIYFFVFFSLLFQVQELIGSTGLLPIAETVSTQEVSYFDFPTLHIWFNSDSLLHLLLFIGMIFSGMLVLGKLPRLSLLSCFVIYLSYVVSGGDFFAFQWDIFLLEATFLALFLPLGGSLTRPSKLGEPSPLVIFLFRWLLFRIYFESGLAKLLYGGSWLNLTAMRTYYETTPLPSFGGWFIQQLSPDWFHAISLVIVFILQLGIPLLFFYPRKARIISFYVLAGFNVLIELTSNFGFFNVLVIVAGLFLLDDEHIKNVWKLGKTWSYRVLKPHPSLKYVGIGLVAFIVPFSFVEFSTFVNPHIDYPSAVDKAVETYEPFRIVNRYHLFPDIPGSRVVIEIEGSHDGRNWDVYRVKYTPQDKKSFPPHLLFYHPRFAFYYYFFPIGRINEPYVQNLMVKLCASPEDVEPLFEYMVENPRYIRMEFYDYFFNSPDKLWRRGWWWEKDYIGKSTVLDCEAVRWQQFIEKHSSQLSDQEIPARQP